MKLRYKLTGKDVPAEISLLDKRDYQKIKKSTAFDFDWTTEQRYEVYKIYLVGLEDEMLGLMSLIDRSDEYRIHLNLLEVSKGYQGKDKELDHIAGCLIAYAAREAIKRGYFGFVSLEPKTLLIDYYQEKYGFRQYGRYLGIEGAASQLLVQKYLDDE